MVCNWEALLKKEKNAKHLLTGLTTYRLTGRKEVVKVLNKLLLIMQQNRIANMK